MFGAYIRLLHQRLANLAVRLAELKDLHPLLHHKSSPSLRIPAFKHQELRLKAVRQNNKLAIPQEVAKSRVRIALDLALSA